MTSSSTNLDNPVPSKSKQSPDDKASKITWTENYPSDATMIYYLVIAVVVYPILSALLFWGLTYLRDTAVIELNRGLITVAALIAYTILSIRKIGPDEQAALLIFGRPWRNLKSGPAFVLWGICSTVIFTTKRIQVVIPDDPILRDKYKNVDKDNEEVFVVRITTGGPTSLENRDSQDPLSQRLTVEPTFVFRFTIMSPMRFVQTIGDIDDAKRQISDTIVATAQVEFAKKTPVLLIASIPEVNTEVHRAAEILIGEEAKKPGGVKHDPWGINLQDAYIETLGITRTVNIAIADRAAAGFKREQRVLEGQGEGGYEKARLTGLGEGEASQLKSRAKGLKAMAKEINTPGGQVAVTMDTIRATLSQNDKVILAGPDLTTAIMGAMAVAGQNLVSKLVQPTLLPKPPDDVPPQRQ